MKEFTLSVSWSGDTDLRMESSTQPFLPACILSSFSVDKSRISGIFAVSSLDFSTLLSSMLLKLNNVSSSRIKSSLFCYAWFLHSSLFEADNISCPAKRNAKTINSLLFGSALTTRIFATLKRLYLQYPPAKC
jgi:hypothetical protein